ncbi:hypothetical protein EDD85DRAFT_789390 [Armillaria nabsnona]|nr:hypothetical protein EDD85DRAFT_789390 [Armillaria nabsnona]
MNLLIMTPPNSSSLHYYLDHKENPRLSLIRKSKRCSITTPLNSFSRPVQLLTHPPDDFTAERHHRPSSRISPTTGSGCMELQMARRPLGNMLLMAPTAQGRENVASRSTRVAETRRGWREWSGGAYMDFHGDPRESRFSCPVARGRRRISHGIGISIGGARPTSMHVITCHSAGMSRWLVSYPSNAKPRMDIFEDLDSDNLENMMSLHVPVHHFLDRFAIYLTAVEGQPNTYRIESFHPLVLKYISGNPVTFTNAPPLARLSIGRVRGSCISHADMAMNGSTEMELFEQWPFALRVPISVFIGVLVKVMANWNMLLSRVCHSPEGGDSDVSLRFVSREDTPGSRCASF